MKSQQKKTKALFLHKILIMIDFSKRLLNWYHSNKRSLPWRQTTEPYHIWISEIILQQTQVKQGLDYYHRFINHFPNLEKLANAPAEELVEVEAETAEVVESVETPDETPEVTDLPENLEDEILE